MKNRFYILLILSLLIILTGCGEIEEEPSDDSTSASTVDSGFVNTPTEEESSDDSTSPSTVDSGFVNIPTETGDTLDDTPPSTTSLSIIGKVTYDRVHVNRDGVGLDYNNITQEPAKQVVVKAIGGDGQTIASTTTDDNGWYALSNLPENTQVKLRVYAQMKKSGVGGWDVKVVDNTNGGSQYVIEGSFATTGTSSTRRNINASSGWQRTSYRGTRAAAPFAILGSIYQAMQKVIVADSDATFPALVVNWSKNNIASNGSLEDGQIVTSHFNGDSLYILGDADSDTDEYDDHIIIHEWGHYFEAKFSRTESIGGSHGNGDRLDIRVAFGEGWGNAWSAIATDNPYYYDTAGSRQASGWYMNIESEFHDTPGWYSEASIQRILYDLYDSNDDGYDSLSMGFKPIYDVLVGAQKNTPAFTSIFSFITALKNENPTEVDKIDDILTSENITSINDIYGSTHHNLYSDMQQGSTVNVCTSTEYGITNKLNTHKYIRFSIAQSGTYHVRVEQSDGNRADPDFALYKTSPFGEVGVSDGTNYGSEEHDYRLNVGDYMLDISDYNDLSRPCFDITVN